MIDYIHRQHNNPESESTRSDKRQGYSDIHSPVFKVCDKLGEVTSETNSKVGIYQDVDCLCNYDSVPLREEVDCHHSEMPVPAFTNSSDDDQRGFRTDRHIISWCTSSVFRSLALQEVTNDPDRGPLRVPVIQFANNSTSTMQGGAELVDSQCETVQQEVSNKHDSRSDSNIRCVQSSMECIRWRSQHQMILGQGGERNSHQYLRADSSRICTPNILQG